MLHLANAKGRYSRGRDCLKVCMNKNIYKQIANRLFSAHSGGKGLQAKNADLNSSPAILLVFLRNLSRWTHHAQTSGHNLFVCNQSCVHYAGS